MIAESTGKTKMLAKKDMKKILGGDSPDFLEACAYRIYFELESKKKNEWSGLQWL